MTAGETHEKINALLAWYVNGTLEDTEEKRVREHLLDCSSCAEEVDVLLEVAGALNHDSIADESTEDGDPRPTGAVLMPAPRRSWMLMLPLAAAFLVAGFLMGWITSQVLPPNDTSDRVRASVRLLDLGGGGSRDLSGEAPLFVSGDADDPVVLLVRAPLIDASLALELRGPEGTILSQGPRDLPRDALGRIAIVVEASLLREPGAYALRITEAAPAESRTFFYPFKVERAP